ncbi:MAG: DsrE/DsrF/DrsH-like family protein [Candidatus Thorarchaeota archaeon]
MENEKSSKNDTLAIIFHSAAYDRIIYGLNLVKTALAYGMDVVTLFTFGALKRLVKDAVDDISSETPDDMKDAIEMGLEVGILLPISEQIREAKRLGLRLHVCVTTMTLFGLSQEDLIEEVDSVEGLGMFVDIARDATMSLYI